MSLSLLPSSLIQTTPTTTVLPVSTVTYGRSDTNDLRPMSGICGTVTTVILFKRDSGRKNVVTED